VQLIRSVYLRPVKVIRFDGFERYHKTNEDFFLTESIGSERVDSVLSMIRRGIMMYDYILVTVRRKKLSVMMIRLFDPNDDSVDFQERNPYDFPEGTMVLTEHGFSLKGGMYPWGNDGDIFPYEEGLLQRLCGYARMNDISGYKLFFQKETDYAYSSTYETE